MKPDEAFPLFQASYRKLAEIYQDKELQQSCALLSQRCLEATNGSYKLAEKYRNKELQRMFLSIILACYSESILDYSKIGKVDEARALYGSLKQLVETHKEEEPELVLRQAKGAVNLVLRLSELTDPTKLKRYTRTSKS